MKRAAAQEPTQDPDQAPRRYKRHALNAAGTSWVDSFELPDELQVQPQGTEFEKLWALHPAELGDVKMFGKPQKTPRWQQAYDRPYRFSGTDHPARPLPDEVKPYLAYANSLPQYKGQFNAVLLNWYQDGRHYIGYHSDDESQMRRSPGGESLVFSVSLGQQRTFALKPRPEQEGLSLKLDMPGNTVLVMGGRCQQTHKHAVPKVDGKKGAKMGRRINMTFRVFVD